MVNNKSETSLIRHIQKKYITLMKIKNIILMLRTHIILLSSFMIYFFCICHSGSFPILVSIRDGSEVPVSRYREHFTEIP